MSIKNAIKTVIEEQVQKSTQAYIQRLTNEYSRITKKLESVDEKLNEALSKLASHNNIIEDRELSGDKIHLSHYTNICIDPRSKPYAFVKGSTINVSNDTIKLTPHKEAYIVTTTPTVGKLPGDSINTNNTAEALAQMSRAELSSFIDSLMDRYPDLGENIMSQISYSLIEKENK